MFSNYFVRIGDKKEAHCLGICGVGGTGICFNKWARKEQ